MSNYPDGTAAPRRGVAHFMCTNSDCKQGGWDVSGVYDLGTFTANNETDTDCPSCGQEGE